MTSLLKEPIIPFVSGNDIRNNMGNTVLLCLVCLHITEPFSVEGIGIFKEACRTAEDFCITGPSKTLISLWCLKNYFLGFTSSIMETCPVNRFFTGFFYSYFTISFRSRFMIRFSRREM